MWWPAIGGLVVGVGGLVFPEALGVGYDTIGALLQGQVAGRVITGLLLVKSVVWSVSLGSGTSGGVLAPLLLMGGALGGVEALVLPDEGTGFWPLVSMGAILGGTMRSPFTGIVFALELTHDVNMLLPLLVSVTLAHGFTVLALRRSILTEKVSRRGYHLSREYAVDPLEILFVREVMRRNVVALPASMELAALRAERPRRQLLCPVVDTDRRLVGVVTRRDLDGLLTFAGSDSDVRVGALVRPDPIVAYPDEPLRAVVYRMPSHGARGSAHRRDVAPRVPRHSARTPPRRGRRGVLGLGPPAAPRSPPRRARCAAPFDRGRRGGAFLRRRSGRGRVHVVHVGKRRLAPSHVDVRGAARGRGVAAGDGGRSRRNRQHLDARVGCRGRSARAAGTGSLATAGSRRRPEGWPRDIPLRRAGTGGATSGPRVVRVDRRRAHDVTPGAVGRRGGLRVLAAGARERPPSRDGSGGRERAVRVAGRVGARRRRARATAGVARADRQCPADRASSTDTAAFAGAAAAGSRSATGRGARGAAASRAACRARDARDRECRTRGRARDAEGARRTRTCRRGRDAGRP